MRVVNITSVRLVCAAIVAGLAWPLAAEEPVEQATPGEEAASQEGAQFQAPTLDYQTGDIVLPSKVATLHLGSSYRYLSPQDAEKVLTAWGNPPGFVGEGAIIPADVDPFTNEGWAVFLSYEEEGHIDDSDAAEIDYADLMKEMQENTENSNPQREQAGYPPIHLVGWAEPPRYDNATKRMYWAKEIRGDSGPHALNYDVRVLGREGVLSMEAVAGMAQFAQIKSEMQPMIKVAEFNEGYRYAEFNPKTDKLAEYGLGALIAGAAATKLGLFAKLGVFLLAAKKFIFIGLAALAGVLMKVFGKKKDESV
jgi:uncharacterized membrane-anchored protein